MNKVIKRITVSTAALLMLLSAGVGQNNVNAAKHHYHNHTMKLVKNHRHNKLGRQSIKSLNIKRTRHNRKMVRKEVNRIKHRTKKSRHSQGRVLKPRYQIVKANRRGNQALVKSGFVDGRILANSDYVFSKYAPNDKRAKLPNYMNPKANKWVRHSPSYNNVNHDLWVKGIFNLKDPKKNTRNPQVYKYYPKVHGWELAPRR